MTRQQRKSKQFAEAIEEFERFKIEWAIENPDASPDEYAQAIAEKAEELDL